MQSGGKYGNGPQASAHPDSSKKLANGSGEMDQGLTQSERKELEKDLGYKFKNVPLITTVLVHPSVLKKSTYSNFERCEFLGDRVLSLTIAELLYKAFPTDSEGDLAHRLAELVKRLTLVNVAQAFGLGRYIHCGNQVLDATTPFSRTILADSCEALIGALFLDGGLEAAQNFIKKQWKEHIASSGEAPPKDPKSALQEWLQGRGFSLPEYKVLTIEGSDHIPEFRVEAIGPKETSAIGKGLSKREAERIAAEKLLETLKEAHGK
ncbi:MAG: ribonuclease III [Alphaproteobacteria bacterium]|nr:ribonuclease III [Alphaproteobacteria bacterium]